VDEKYYVPYNFAAIPREYIAYDTARVVILPVPFESTTTFLPGTRNAPTQIINASGHMELYDEELEQKTCAIGICTEPELALPGDPPGAVKAVKRSVKKLLDDDKLVCVIGGEHTVTIGCVEAVRERFPDLSVLYLDAHADLRESYGGMQVNHACVASRLAETCPVVQIGVRSLSEDEAPLLNSGNVTTVFAREVHAGYDIDSVIDKLTENVYITIDMDVFDPAVVPAVGTPEPGGLDWWQVNAILETVCKKRRVSGFDVVELCPIPASTVSEYVTARLIYRLIGLIARSRKWVS
jgi:agmatinase